jgi:hypothetical protein
MPSVPAPADPGRDGDPAWLDRDPMTAAEREAWLDRLCAQDDDPADAPQEYWDPGSCAPPPGQDELTADELAGIRDAAADEMLPLDAASTGRRGPGQAGSARVFPGESASRAAGFGTGMAWDVTPGCAQLAVAADAAVEDAAGGSLSGVADHELVGLVWTGPNSGICRGGVFAATSSSACSGKGSLALSGSVVSAFRRARSAATSSRNSGISAQCSQHSGPGISADTLLILPWPAGCLPAGSELTVTG